MEAATLLQEPQTRSIPFEDEIKVPGDFLLGPIFAARRQSNAREITIGTRRYTIGGFDPDRPYHKPPALDIRHGRALLTALSFWNPYESTREIYFSMNQFCQRYAKTNGGRYSRDIAQLFRDLCNTFIRVTDIETGEMQQYTFFEKIITKGSKPRRSDTALARSPRLEFGPNGCVLSEGFFAVMGRTDELRRLKLKVLNEIRSPIAQAIYLYIPSRAYHHNADKPFPIALSKLMQQVGLNVPRFACLREQVFTQHEKKGNSVMQQLENAEVRSGKLHVFLTENKDGTDFIFNAWVERIASKKLSERDSKLVAAYRESGGPLERLEWAFANPSKLTCYETDLLESANVTINRSLPFLMIVKSLLGGNVFEAVLAEVKGYVKEKEAAGVKNAGIKKTVDHKLIYDLITTVRIPPTRPTFSVPDRGR